MLEGLREYIGSGTVNVNLVRDFHIMPAKYYEGNTIVNTEWYRIPWKVKKAELESQGNISLDCNQGNTYECKAAHDKVSTNYTSSATTIVMNDTNSTQDWAADDIMLNKDTGELLFVTTSNYNSGVSETLTVKRGMMQTDAEPIKDIHTFYKVEARVFDVDFFNGFRIYDAASASAQVHIAELTNYHDGSVQALSAAKNGVDFKMRFTRIKRAPLGVNNIAALLIYL